MSKFSAVVVVTGVSTLVAGPASAATKSCGAVKGVGNQTVVSKVKTSSGSCPTAKTVAKRFARTRVAPDGYTCREKLSPPTPAWSARVTCKGTGRTITFKVAWNGALPDGSGGGPLPAAPAPPNANASG